MQGLAGWSDSLRKFCSDKSLGAATVRLAQLAQPPAPALSDCAGQGAVRLHPQGHGRLHPRVHGVSIWVAGWPWPQLARTRQVALAPPARPPARPPTQASRPAVCCRALLPAVVPALGRHSHRTAMPPCLLPLGAPCAGLQRDRLCLPAAPRRRTEPDSLWEEIPSVLVEPMTPEQAAIANVGLVGQGSMGRGVVRRSAAGQAGRGARGAGPGGQQGSACAPSWAPGLGLSSSCVSRPTLSNLCRSCGTCTCPRAACPSGYPSLSSLQRP